MKVAWIPAKILIARRPGFREGMKFYVVAPIDRELDVPPLNPATRQAAKVFSPTDLIALALSQNYRGIPRSLVALSLSRNDGRLPQLLSYLVENASPRIKRAVL